MKEDDRRRAVELQLAQMQPTAGGRSGDSLATGFPTLDRALGTGGLARGIITEVFGPASCGKTAFLLQVVAHGQQHGSTAAWIDAEHVFDAGFASHLGVDVTRLTVTAPESAEEALEMARRLAVSGAIDLIAIDSAAALVPRLELQTPLGAAGAGLQSRILSSELRRLAQIAVRSRTAIVLLNQTRFRQAAPGEAETSAGGLSIKLYAAVRIALSASGRRVRFRIVKNRLDAAFREAQLEWRRESGFVESR